jgi:hypothetical protein
VNLKIAKGHGMTIPEAILLRADEIIQLVDQRRRNQIGSGRHDHLVKGGVL